jgi:dihydropyrimidinase
MASIDLVIRGGKIVRHDGISEGSIAVNEGKILAVGSADSMPSAKRTIDVGGQHVFPGIVDVHVHFQTFANPFDENCRIETRSAAVGGCTTIVPMLLNSEDATLSFFEYVPWARDALERNSILDAGFSLVVATDDHIAALPQMASEFGICSYKFYMAYTEDEARWFGIRAISDGQLLEGMRIVRDIGHPAMVMVHAENMSIIHYLKRKLQDEGRDDLRAWSEARATIAEEEATRRALFYAQETGTRLYIVHMTTERGVQWTREARAAGVNVIAETCPHFLVFDHDHPAGALAKTNPPMRDSSTIDALWRGVADGGITCVGSDHSTVYPRERKLSTDIWANVPGYPGMATLLPVMLSEGYHKGRLSLERIAAVLAYNNAVVYGLYPQKGAIQPGADADFAIVDIDRRRLASPDYLQSAADWSPYESMELRGWPTMTILRGEVIMDDGEITIEQGYGKYIPRYPGKVDRAPTV